MFSVGDEVLVVNPGNDHMDFYMKVGYITDVLIDTFEVDFDGVIEEFDEIELELN